MEDSKIDELYDELRGLNPEALTAYVGKYPHVFGFTFREIKTSLISASFVY